MNKYKTIYLNNYHCRKANQHIEYISSLDEYKACSTIERNIIKKQKHAIILGIYKDDELIYRRDYEQK